MIIEKYGAVKHQNDYYGKRVVCRSCGSRLIIQDDPEKHMIVMKGDNVTIIDHLNKEEDK